VRGPEEITQALRTMASGMDELSAKFSTAPAVVDSLEAVLGPVRPALDVTEPAGEVLRFLPEGGSVTGLLRALQPVVNLNDDGGFLPLRRHGSTTAGLLSLAELLAAVGHADAVVALDDFGDNLDTASAERLAGLLRRKVGQLWLSTRRPETARSFAPDELVRLSRSTPGRGAHHGRVPTGRAERLAARHLLPAMTARAVAVCEGTHDSAALTALAERLDRERGVAPPSAHRVRLLDADGIVVRLPHRTAIERALTDGVPASALVAALRQLEVVYGLRLPRDLDRADEATVRNVAMRQLKDSNGLHAEFVAALPAGSLPPLATRLLAVMLELAEGTHSGTVDL
jgi:hypothetical protein